MLFLSTDEHLENAVQFFWHLRSKGFAHGLMMTLSQNGCHKWPKEVPPPGVNVGLLLYLAELLLFLLFFTHACMLLLIS